MANDAIRRMIAPGQSLTIAPDYREENPGKVWPDHVSITREQQRSLRVIVKSIDERPAHQRWYDPYRTASNLTK